MEIFLNIACRTELHKWSGTFVYQLNGVFNLNWIFHTNHTNAVVEIQRGPNQINLLLKNTTQVKLYYIIL